MGTTGKNFIFTVPQDIETDAANIRKNEFYGKSTPELYKYLICKGLDIVKQRKSGKKNEAPRIRKNKNSG